jgi:hypothetical protein
VCGCRERDKVCVGGVRETAERKTKCVCGGEIVSFLSHKSI